MNILEDSMLVYHVAKYYYEDQLNQNAIANLLGISRPQISRILKYALETGIVTISITQPQNMKISRLENELANHLGLKRVVIIPSTKIEHFFFIAAQYVDELLKNCKNIGIGWGRSVYRISCNLSSRSIKSASFCPLLGYSGNRNPYLQVNTIVDRFAEHYHASSDYLNLPVYKKQTDTTADDKRLFHFFQKKWRLLDAAVIGLGTYNQDDSIYIDELSYDPFMLENSDQILGDILAHLLPKNQSEEFLLPDYYLAACPLNILKKIPNTIAIARGLSKKEIILRASRDQYIHTLITDLQTAEAILNT